MKSLSLMAPINVTMCQIHLKKKNLLSAKQLHFVGKEIPNHTMS